MFMCILYDMEKNNIHGFVSHTSSKKETTFFQRDSLNKTLLNNLDSSTFPCSSFSSASVCPYSLNFLSVSPHAYPVNLNVKIMSYAIMWLIKIS